jgi:hypothetical protein
MKDYYLNHLYGLINELTGSSFGIIIPSGGGPTSWPADIKTKLIDESNFVLSTCGLLYLLLSIKLTILFKCNKISIPQKKRSKKRLEKQLFEYKITTG